MLPIIPALLFVMGAPGILNGITNMYPPFAALMARRGYRAHPDLIPTLEGIVQQRIRNQLTDDEYRATMAEAGYNHVTANRMLASAQSYLSALDYITLWRRGEMDEEALNAQLDILGIMPDQIQKVKSVTLYYPNPVDIVRFAVRDAYTPETVENYQLDADMPEDYLPAGRKAGLSDELAKLYWRSHWELPSPTQVFEMLHRRIITEEEVDDYLRVADYMKPWRDKLAKISYTPLTRVDVRRMHAMGVLDAEAVYNSYRDIGYDDKNAQLMTEFTIRYNEGTEGEAPKAEVMRAYNAGLITRDEAVAKLKTLNYSDDAIKTSLDLADAAINQERIDLASDAIIDNYTRGIISLNTVYTQLTQLGVPPRMMELTVQRELAQARKRAKTATKSDLDQWYKMRIITKPEYTHRMAAIGYSGPDITSYLAENDIDYILTGKNKYPYAEVFSEYAQRDISESELRSALAALEFDTHEIDTLVNIADAARAQINA